MEPPASLHSDASGVKTLEEQTTLFPALYKKVNFLWAISFIRLSR
jgi:hypothetical protein